MCTWGSTSGGDRSRPSASSSSRPSAGRSPAGRMAAIVSSSTRTSRSEESDPVVGCSRAFRTISPRGATSASSDQRLGSSGVYPPSAASVRPRSRRAAIRHHPGVVSPTEVPQGPRVISARLPGSRSVSVAAYVLAGSRLEAPAEAGVAHFMEHLTFKGTQGCPSSRAISEAVEGVGGSANAATDRESTVYWVRVPRREAVTAMNVLGELIVRPCLDEADIDQERTVIVEEIRSYLDDPSEYAQMLIQRALFGEGALGREICGDEDGIRALPTSTIREFWTAAYRPANTV